MSLRYFPIAVVRCAGIKETLISKCTELAASVQHFIIEQARMQNYSIISRYEAILERVSRPPKDELELMALATYVEESEATVDGLKGEVKEVFERLYSLDPHLFRVPEDDFNLAWSTKTYVESYERDTERDER